MKLLRVISLMLALFITEAYSVGNTAVITLEFPHGAENTGLGECGVSYANSIHSVFWNPANAAFLGNRLKCQFDYSFFGEQLLPIFDIPDLYHLANLGGFFLYDRIPYVDLGYVFSNNYLNFGKVIEFNAQGTPIDTFYAYETVFSHTLSFSALKILGVGFNIKHFKSKLTDKAIATGAVFDCGFRLQKEFNLYDIVKILPAAGLAFHSYGQKSVRYTENGKEDPLPRKLWYGFSTEFTFLDFFSYTYVREEEKSTVEDEYINHEGQKFQFTPFYSFIIGFMLDTAGHREELTKGFSLTFNYQNTFIFMNNLIRLSNLMKKSSIDTLRYSKKFNIYASYGRNKIYSIDSPAREGQTRHEFSIGINFFPKKDDFDLRHLIKDIRKDKKPVKKVISEQDGELVE